MPIEQINNSSGAVLYLHHDQQGSTRLLTGSTGKVEGKCSYSAYGTPTCEGTAATPLGYDGQYTSSDTGLIYMRAREYDPSTAQFLTRDPLVALTGQPYSYAADSPLNYEDPSGAISLPTIVTVVVAGGADVGCGLTAEVPGVDALTCGGAADADSAAAADLAGDEAASVGADDTGAVDGEDEGDDGGSCGEEGGGTLRHYTTNEGAEGIDALGQIRPSEDGLTYLTPDEYADGASAQAGLAMSQTPDGYFEVPSPVGAPEPSPVVGGTGREVPVPGPVPSCPLEHRSIPLSHDDYKRKAAISSRIRLWTRRRMGICMGPK